MKTKVFAVGLAIFLMLGFALFAKAQSCPSMLFFCQDSKPWGPKPLGFCSKSVGEIGCAMTSVTMMIRFFDPGSRVDPEKLNNWLKNNNGYSGCDIIWKRAADYSNRMFYITTHYTSSLKTLDNYLSANHPVVIEVRNSSGGQHFVVALYKYNGNYYIHDPCCSNGAGINLRKYKNKIYRIFVYGLTPGAPSKNQKIATTWANMKKR